MIKEKLKSYKCDRKGFKLRSFENNSIKRKHALTIKLVTFPNHIKRLG